jgi:hypothetical protein
LRVIINAYFIRAKRSSARNFSKSPKKPVVAITAYISNTKNENSFYVAAVVKLLFLFFPSVPSFLDGHII